MFAIIDWPSNLGLRPSGVEMLPAALRQAGLISRLGARDAGSVVPRAEYDSSRSDETGVLNGPGLREALVSLAGAVANAMQRDDIAIVLAGDCSVILGGLLGARMAMQSRDLPDRVALLFIDGHVDFYQPEASPTGEAADMDLALATGRGPAILTTFDDRTPLVLDEDVAAVGARDSDEREKAGSQDIRATGIRLLELASIRQRGIDVVAEEALEVVAHGSAQRFWCHIDADVLDDAVMPAVDYRQAGGLSPDELTTLLRKAWKTERMAGLSIAIYNPALDPQRDGARLLVDVVVRALHND
jgi:arginase